MAAEGEMKPLPRARDCETNVLGCCISDPGLIDKHGITPGLFYEERDGIILNTIIEMKAKNLLIGDLEVWEHLKKKGLREKLCGLCPGGSIFNYLGLLVYWSVQGNTKVEVEKLKKFTLKRALWKRAHQIIRSMEKEVYVNG